MMAMRGCEERGQGGREGEREGGREGEERRKGRIEGERREGNSGRESSYTHFPEYTSSVEYTICTVL